MSWKIAVSHRECPFMIYKGDHVEPKNWMECVYDSNDRKDCEQFTCPLAIKPMTKEEAEKLLQEYGNLRVTVIYG